MWPEEHFEVATGHAFPGCLVVAASFFPFAWHAGHFASYIWGRKICGSRFIPRPITFVQIRLPDVAESECPGQRRRDFFLSIAHGINAFAVGSGNSKFIFPVVESELRMFAQHGAAVRASKRARHRRHSLRGGNFLVTLRADRGTRELFERRIHLRRPETRIL